MSRNPLKLDEEELQILRDFERESLRAFSISEQRGAAWKQPPEEHTKRISASTFAFPPATWRSYKNEPPWNGSPIRH